MAGVNKVSVFDEEGRFLRVFALQKPLSAVGVAVAANGRVYVSDQKNSGVLVCNAEGAVLRQFGSRGTFTGQFRTPCHAAIDSKRELLVVADSENNRCQIFKLDGTFVRSFGVTIGDGHLCAPAGVCVNAAGEIAVSGLHNHCIQVRCFCVSVVR